MQYQYVGLRIGLSLIRNGPSSGQDTQINNGTNCGWGAQWFWWKRSSATTHISALTTWELLAPIAISRTLVYWSNSSYTLATFAALIFYSSMVFLFIFFLALSLSVSDSPTPYILGTSFSIIDIEGNRLTCISSIASQSVANSLCIPFRSGDYISANFLVDLPLKPIKLGLYHSQLTLNLSLYQCFHPTLYVFKFLLHYV